MLMLVSDDKAAHASNGITHDDTAQLDLAFAERRVGVLDRGAATVDEDVALPTTIVKRDGRVVAFDPFRIERAIARCFAALGRQPYTPIAEVALRVVNIMSARGGEPTVEGVQDVVELTLQAAGEFEAAKAYILYRAEHAKQRQERPIRTRCAPPSARPTSTSRPPSRSFSSSTSTAASTTTRDVAKRGSKRSTARCRS